MPPPFAILFSTPLAAAAVAVGAAAVPVVIHLLNRKRYVVVPWAAMRFLLAARKKNTKRLQVEQWLLLATRALVLLALVLAMAAVMPWSEPFWQRFFPGNALPVATQGRTHRIIVLDASFTMATRRGDDQSRFDAAKAQARRILEDAGPGDGFSLVLMAQPAQVIVTGPADDRARVLRELDDLRLPHGGSDNAGALHAVAEIVAKSKALGKHVHRDIYLITDLRRTAWPTPSPDGDWKAITDAARTVFIDVAGRDEENVAVTGLTMKDSLPLVRTDLSITATVQNFGRRPRGDLAIGLWLGRVGSTDWVPLEQRQVNLDAGGTLAVTFALDKQNRFRDPGQYVLQVRAGEDALRLDDVRSLAITVRETVPVMVVNGKPAAEPLERGSGFVVRALNPYPEGVRSPQSPADVRILSPREFADAGLGDLFRPDAPTDLVFLCDLPAIGGNEAARLEAHLKRGGSVVIGLGPNAARNIDGYNRVLFDDGKGLLPGRIEGVRRAPPGKHFSLATDESSFDRLPLSEFKTDQERASFGTPRFTQYLKLDVPAGGLARRLFDFVPSEPGAEPADPAVVAVPRHRGQVIVFASSLNADWNEWPKTLSFPPFVQELLRFSLSGSARQTLTAGDALEEFVPTSGVRARAVATHEDGTELEAVEVVAAEEAGVARIAAVDRVGVYRLKVGGGAESLFAVNPPTATAQGTPESDLRRWSADEFRQAAGETPPTVVGDVDEVPPRATTGPATSAEVPVEPQGPSVARIVVFALLSLLVVESLLAWWFGSARAGTIGDPMRVRPRRWLAPLWMVPACLALVALAAVGHARWTGRFLGFLPGSLRDPVERFVDVPAAAPGEGTRWRLESLPVGGSADAWVIAVALIVAALFAWRLYRGERPGTSTARGGPRPRLTLLRWATLALAIVVLAPQVKLVFEREGWPDLVLAIDDSQSMGVVDSHVDPDAAQRAAELKEEWQRIAAPRIKTLDVRIAELEALLDREPSSAQSETRRIELADAKARLADLKDPHRLNLAKASLLADDGDWLRDFVARRQVRLHVYRLSSQPTLMATLRNPTDVDAFLADLIDLRPVGESSQLGPGVSSVVKSFRGNPLDGILLLTDGVNTRGESLSAAAKEAGRAGVPLYLVGVGDDAEPIDASLGDLRAEDSILVGDRLVIDATLNARGNKLPPSITVVLGEIKDGGFVEVARQEVAVDAAGKPTKFRFLHQPTEAGEKTYVIAIPAGSRLADDADASNERLEHRVFVAEAKKLRVLLVEGYPRYDHRYMKALFERESDQSRGNKSIEVDSYLLSADPEHPKQDRTSINRFPTPEELRKYDAVFLGDVDPRQLPRSAEALESLAKYVKENGGGLLMLAGERSSPHAYRDTPLADVMPVTCDGPAPAAPELLKIGYRPRLTAGGRQHAVFRFSTDESENADLWEKLPPLYWFARGYRAKLGAEVLAVHPDIPAEGGSRDENHPLMLQQFVGAGRVLFIGFDDTWRWRFRQNEVRFNQFWIQAVRSLARGRVGRTEIRTDRRSYRRDEPVRVTVRFPDDAPPPTEAVTVRVDRKLRGRGDGETESRTIQLTPRDGTRASFETLLTRTPEGDYSFTLAGPLPAGTPPRTEAKVLPPPGELDRLRLDRPEMELAARDSRGWYAPLHAANLDDIPPGPRVALDQPVPPLSLWNHPATFVLLLWLLASEWTMRKKWRLL